MIANFKNLLNIIPRIIKKKSIFVLLLSVLSTLLDIILLLCVIPLIKFLQNPANEEVIFEETISAISPRLSNSYESFGIIEFAFFMITIAILASCIKLFFFRNSAYLSAQASNDLIKSFFTSRLNSREIIIEKDTKSNFFSMLHKIDIISNTYFVLLSASASLILILFTTAMLFFLDPSITLLVVLITVTLYLLMYFLTKKSINNASSLININSDLRSKAILNSLSSIREAILYDKVDYFMTEVAKKDKLFRYSRARIQFFGQLPRAIFESITIIIVLSISLTLTKSSGYNNMELLPILGAFLLAFQRMLPQFQTIYGAYNEFIGAAEIITSFYDSYNDHNKIDIGQESIFSISKKPIKNFSEFKKITLSNISFKYKDSQVNTLDNLNLVINKNSKIAIIGPSGVGKSTLVDLILGFHQANHGSIFVDDEEVDERNIDAYRSLFSYVPQRIGILNKSIFQNITLSENKKSYEDDVIDALKISKLFQEDKEINLDEEIGEGGESISGGQAQRLAIARMLFFSRKIIIFDESTSSLDKKTESEILENISSIKDVTFIHITHKLNKKYYDKIFEISSSGISEINDKFI